MDAVAGLLGFGASILPLQVVRVAVDGAEGKPRERFRGVLMLGSNWTIVIRTRGGSMPNIALTQGLDVQRPLLIIFDEIGDIETGRCNGLRAERPRIGKTGTRDSNMGHVIDNK